VDCLRRWHRWIPVAGNDFAIAATAEVKLREACGQVFEGVGESLRNVCERWRRVYGAAESPERAKSANMGKLNHKAARVVRVADSLLPYLAQYNPKVPTTMANHAYLRVWTRDFSLETMIAEFARFLATAPLSATQPAFSELIVQAVDATEDAPWRNGICRRSRARPAEVAALALQNLNADTAYIASANGTCGDSISRV